MDADSRLNQFLAENNLVLPPPPSVIGLYKPVLQVGSVCYTSGHLPLKEDGSLYVGKVGDDADQQTGFTAARQCGLAMLSSLKAKFGTINRIQQVIKLLAFVNSSDGFTQQPAVVNGCSELFAAVFGNDAGIGTRSAVGVNALPLNVMVEVEGIFLLSEN